MDELIQDIRYALRTFAKNPAFTAAAAATLALGIGATTSVFSVVDALLLRPLPYPDSERLVAIRSNVSLPDMVTVAERARSFESAGVENTFSTLDLTGRGEPYPARAAIVDHGLLQTLGAKAAIGRILTPAECAFGGERAVVLSNGFFVSQFGADESIVGTSITLSGNPYTIVGVMPPTFRLPVNVDVFAAAQVVMPDAAKARGAHFLNGYLKLKPGATLAAAQTELDGVVKYLAETYPSEAKGITMRLVPLRDQLFGETRPTVLILFGAVGLVLLVASSNFAGLLLSHALSRRRELVVRAALGAGRVRLVRQLLTESLLLALLGGTLGTLLAPWLLQLLLSLRPDALPDLAAIRLDLRVLAFTFATSLLTGLVFGLVPALRLSRPQGPEELADGGRAGTAGPRRTRITSALVTLEVAVALVLAVGAGLLVKTFRRLQDVDPGFEPRALLTMRVDLPEARYKEIPKQIAFRRQLFASLAELPVVAGVVSDLPLSGEWVTHNTLVDGWPAVPEGEEPEVQSRGVAGDYFRTMGLHLLKGRLLTDADREGAPLAGIVNEEFVKQHLKGIEPLGARVRWARENPPQWITVVGVVRDVKHFGLDQPDQPALYTPFDQSLQNWKRWMTIVVRAAQPAAPGVAAAVAPQQIVDRVHALDPLLPVTRVRTMESVATASLAPRRFGMSLLAAFAALAVLLAAVGLYGVLAHAVVQRTREFGVRIALGAERRAVLTHVLSHGLRLTALGAALGLAAALAATRLLSSLLFEVSAADPITYLTLTLVVFVAAIVACLLPAFRATRVDPIVALRWE